MSGKLVDFPVAGSGNFYNASRSNVGWYRMFIREIPCGLSCIYTETRGNVIISKYVQFAETFFSSAGPAHPTQLAQTHVLQREKESTPPKLSLSHTCFLYVCFPLPFSLSFPSSHFSTIFYLGFCTYMWTRRKLFGYGFAWPNRGGIYCVDRFRSLDVYKLARPPPHLNGCWENTRKTPKTEFHVGDFPA